MWYTVDIVQQIKPKYVIWENVKNILSKKHKHNFDNYIEMMEQLGYNNYYQILNAKDYGIPQNRERVYTISIRKDIDNKKFKFPEKEELTIRLKDILEADVDEKYYLKNEQIENFIKNNNGNCNPSGRGINGKVHQGNISPTITTNKGEGPKIDMLGLLDIKGNECVRRVYSQNGISPTLTNMQGGNRQPKVLEDPYIVASRGRNPDNPSSRKAGEHLEQRLETNKSGVSNCISTVQKDNYVVENKIIYEEPLKRKGWHRKACEVLNTNGITTCIHTQSNNLLQKIKETETCRIRKLTPLECWRLMRIR